ncbi:MAG: HIT family protein [Pseudomonadota bacterium]
MEDQRHETFQTFGWPGTCIRDYTHWSVLVRPVQVTLGAMVLISKSDATAYSDLPNDAFGEMGSVIKDIEQAAGKAFGYQKINYLMLMMKDPQVHFHVLPRYKSPQSFASHQVDDIGWPGPPDLSSGPSDAAFVETVRQTLRDAWPT